MSLLSRPSELLQHLGVEHPSEIDVEAIAEYCGAEVRYARLGGCDACLVGTPQRAIITVSTESSPERQRFSIGHEIGHWIHDRRRLGFLCTKTDISSLPPSSALNPETRANDFSANLLMPEYLFKPAAKGSDMSFNSVRPLKDLFSTSTTATAIRLVQLGPKPAMVACYRPNGSRRWFQRGPLVPEEFFPVDEVPHESPAFELLMGKRKETLPSAAPAEAWVSARGSRGDYQVIEHSIKARDEVLVMIWWKRENQIVDFVERQETSSGRWR